MTHTPQGIAFFVERMTESEKDRLIAGRKDWREFDWQDHCGDPLCEHCEGAYIPDGNPATLPEGDKKLREFILGAASPAPPA